MAFRNASSDIKDIVQELVRRVNESSRRIRDLEEENRSLQSKIQSLEERVIDKERKHKENLDELDGKAEDLSTRVMKTENAVSKLKKRMSDVPRKSEFEELKNYADLLSPLRSGFLTEPEIKSLIKEELDKRV